VSPRTFFSTSKSEDKEDKEDKEEDEEEEVKKTKKTTTPRIRVKNVLIVAKVRGSHKQPHASPLLPVGVVLSFSLSLF
jgi:hypothetical protein